MTTTDLSNWATLALVDKLAAVNDELIGRGQPARDIAAELGVDSIEELRAFAIADDRARDGVISPIECAPWCTEGDGHPDEIFHEDQTCFGPSTYLQVSKNDHVDNVAGHVDQRIGVMAYREPGLQPNRSCRRLTPNVRPAIQDPHGWRADSYGPEQLPFDWAVRATQFCLIVELSEPQIIDKLFATTGRLCGPSLLRCSFLLLLLRHVSARYQLQRHFHRGSPQQADRPQHPEDDRREPMPTPPGGLVSVEPQPDEGGGECVGRSRQQVLRLVRHVLVPNLRRPQPFSQLLNRERKTFSAKATRSRSG